MRKTLIIFLLPIVLVVNIFGQKRSAKTSESNIQTKTTQKEISKNWKLVDLGDFSLLLPISMEDKKVRGKDSAVWLFEDDEMEFYIDSGMYKVNFNYDIEEYAGNTKWIEIDKVKGQSIAIDFTKPKSTETNAKISAEEFQKPLLDAIVFYREKSFYSSFWIRYKKLEQKETATKILQSIKFKQK